MDDANPPFVTVYKPVAGWKPLLLSWEIEGDFQGYTPLQTYFYAFETRDEAFDAARQWAAELGVEFRPEEATTE